MDIATANLNNTVQEKPTIHIIHNLARSGGTLFSKCLGCMDNIALLSEIHPDAQNASSFNAIKQAEQWLNFDPAVWQANDFVSAIHAIKQHCSQLNRTLLLRDWSHIDYLGVPVTTKPSKQATLLNTLKKDFKIQNIQLIRNPVDTWLSTRRLNLIKAAKISSTDFIQAYLTFLNNTSSGMQLLYEDFLIEPNHSLIKACSHLNIEFDDNYKNKWYQFNQITGDQSNLSSHRTKPVIKPRARRTMQSQEIAEIMELQNHPAFEKILTLVPKFNCYTM